ncbi:sensor histidine kinase [Bradyrhizobium sp. USDA 10063]
MSEVAAKADVSAHRRRRLRVAQLVAISQALIVVACILLLRLLPPDGPENYARTEFTLQERGVTGPVTLPHFTSSRLSLEDPPRFAGTFTWTGSEAEHAWSVFLPRFINAVEVAVNGVVILDSRRDAAANRPNRNTPAIAMIPSSLLRQGQNQLTVRLFVWGPLKGFLDRVYVGPDETLRPSYNARALLFVTLPVMFSAWQAILAVILAIMWVMRRHEPAYGVLAAAMMLGFVQQVFLPPPVRPALDSALSAILVASAPTESALVVSFALLFFGRRWPRYGALLFAPSLALVAAGPFASQATTLDLFMWIGAPTVGFCLILLAAIVFREVVMRRDVASFLLGCAITIVLTSWVHDIAAVFGITSDPPIFVTRLSYSAMLVAIGAGLTWRFARALNEVDSFAGHLVTRVREAEERLKASFAGDEERARAAALALERTRLMRDLHDGLGGQLVSIVALAERSNASATIAEAARAALKDLRLVIDSMDDIGGDLMLALGTWRERAMAQLRSHDIALEWRVASAQGMPVHPELRPWHVIQIVRLLDEALTNAVRHAEARRVTVTIETLTEGPDAGRGCISIEDDGKGFAITPDGAATEKPASRGLRNMRSRAKRCGAEFDLSSDASGTRVRLKLPLRFPDGDGVTG